MKKTLVIAAALRGLSGVGAAMQGAQVNAATTGIVNPTKLTPWTSAVIPMKAVVQIDYMPGYGIAVWSSPNNTVIKGKTLKTGTKWQVFEMASINGHAWYNLGGSQWIDGTFLNILTSQTAIVGKKPASVQQMGWFYKHNSYAVFSTGKVLRPGTKWHIYAEKPIYNGMLYNLGGNQWVESYLFD